MADFYFDSSAVVKRYVIEAGSAWVNSLFADPRHSIYTARVTGAEVVAAIVRRARGGSLVTPQPLLRQFRQEFGRRIVPIPVNPSLILDAMDLAEAHALRGYDAVHLAAARAAQRFWAVGPPPITSVSSDLELNAAARAEGLVVEDPNNYP